MSKSYAYRKRCIEKLSSKSYAEKYNLNKLYMYVSHNFLKQKIMEKEIKLSRKEIPHARNPLNVRPNQQSRRCMQAELYR